MERWYNVNFNIMDKWINENTCWVTFEQENLDRVLKLLSLTGPIKFNKHPREKMADGTFKTQEIDITKKWSYNINLPKKTTAYEKNHIFIVIAGF